MSEDAHEYEEELKSLISEMRTILERDVPKLRGPAKIEKCEFLKNRLNRAKTVLKGYNAELRLMPRAEVKPYEARSKDYDEQLARLLQDIQWALSSAESEDMGLSVSSKFDVESATNKEIVDRAKYVQEKSLASTANSKALVQDAIKIGSATATELGKQTEQLQNVSKKVDVVESNLKRADKQIRAFIRRMATDKLVMIFAGLIILGVIAVIVVAILAPKLGFKSPINIGGNATPAATPSPRA